MMKCVPIYPVDYLSLVAVLHRFASPKTIGRSGVEQERTQFRHQPFRVGRIHEHAESEVRHPHSTEHTYTVHVKCISK